MEDLNKIRPNGGQGDPSDGKDCRLCHESLEMPPTARELKKGIEDPVLICLAKPCRQVMPDGVYPRLTSLCRGDKTLCGGLLWKPIGPAMIAEPPEKPYFQLRAIREERPVVEQRKASKKPQHINRRVEAQQQEQDDERRPRKDKFRKPYKVA